MEHLQSSVMRDSFWDLFLFFYSVAGWPSQQYSFENGSNTAHFLQQFSIYWSLSLWGFQNSIDVGYLPQHEVAKSFRKLVWTWKVCSETLWTKQEEVLAWHWLQVENRFLCLDCYWINTSIPSAPFACFPAQAEKKSHTEIMSSAC